MGSHGCPGSPHRILTTAVRRQEWRRGTGTVRALRVARTLVFAAFALMRTHGISMLKFFRRQPTSEVVTSVVELAALWVLASRAAVSGITMACGFRAQFSGPRWRQKLCRFGALHWCLLVAGTCGFGSAQALVLGGFGQLQKRHFRDRPHLQVHAAQH